MTTTQEKQYGYFDICQGKTALTVDTTIYIFLVFPHYIALTRVHIQKSNSQFPKTYDAWTLLKRIQNIVTSIGTLLTIYKKMIDISFARFAT